MRRAAAAVLLALALGLAGCGSGVSFPGGLMEKGTLSETTPEPEDYGLYVYLLAMRGANPQKVDALVRAFACNFNERYVAKSQAPPARKALLLLPLNEPLPADAGPAELRATYGHDLAFNLMTRVRPRSAIDLSGIYVVASNDPLSRLAPGSEPAAVVNTVTLYSATQIEFWLFEMQAQVESGEVRAHTNFTRLAMSIADAFADTAVKLTIINQAWADPELVCRHRPDRSPDRAGYGLRVRPRPASISPSEAALMPCTKDLERIELGNPGFFQRRSALNPTGSHGPPA